MKPSNLVFSDFETTRHILSSIDFARVNISNHLEDVKAHTSYDFVYLTKYSSDLLPFLNGESHTNLKKHLVKHLSVKSIVSKKHITDKILDEAFGTLKNATYPDLVDHFTDEIFLNIIEHFIGIQLSNRKEFNDLISIATLIVEPLLSISTLKKMDHAYKQINTLVEQSKNNCPKESIYFELLHDNNSNLEIEQIQTLIVTLAVGAHTFTELASNFLVEFAKVDSNYKTKMKDKIWLHDHIDHLIRLFASTEYLGRQTNRDQVINGCPINKGERVYMYIPDANRDPKKFHNKNDIKSIDGMRPSKHMSFGAGSHVCPGNFFTQILLEDFIYKFVNQVSKYSIDQSKISYKTTIVAKRLKSLPLLDIKYY